MFTFKQYIQEALIDQPPGVDLRPGKMNKNQLNAVFRRTSQKHLDKITYDSKGKLRSMAGYEKAVKKSKQREHADERDNAERGGTDYWSFRDK